MDGNRMTHVSAGARRAGIVAAALFGIGLGGCLPINEWHPSETDRTGSVDVVKMDHQVRFTGDAATLSAEERSRLDSFVNTVDLGYGDIVTVAMMGDAAMTRRRAQLVRAHLAARKISSQLVARQPGDGAADTVAVSVARHVVTPPQCPDWTKNATQDIFTEQSSNFGCANAHALSVMVANPGDLIRGRSPGPGDGEALALGVRRYREGEITPLVTGEIGTTD